MKIEIAIGETGSIERATSIKILREEIKSIKLHIAFAEKLNRNDLYLQRHSGSDNNQLVNDSIDPNTPLRAKADEYKITIPEHFTKLDLKNLKTLVKSNQLQSNGRYCEVNSIFAIPISDLTSNLLRPSFNKNKFGSTKYRIFFLKDEPINDQNYWCVCYYQRSGINGIEFRNLKFDILKDTVFDTKNPDIDLVLDYGLIWAAAIVPLVIDNKPLSATDIAVHDYDLRQILGRNESEAVKFCYKGWFSKWNERVRLIVQQHQETRKPFASFYHSIIAISEKGDLHIKQLEGTLPAIANKLSSKGFQAAGLLDSGGSCAIYDRWLSGYLNHGWYFRPKRGSIIVLELKRKDRIPIDSSEHWINYKGDF